MKTVRTFGRFEDACIFAAWLSSSGIDATVNDDSALGGNVLPNSTPNLVRVEVPEDVWEDAMQAAQEWQPESPRADSVPELVNELPSETTSIRLFRFLVILEAILFLLGGEISMRDFDRLPENFQDHLNSMVVWERLSLVNWSLRGVYQASCLVSSGLCLLFFPIGRRLFAFTFVWGIGSQLLGSGSASSPIGAAINGLDWALNGGILAMCHTGPVARRFAASGKTTSAPV